MPNKVSLLDSANVARLVSWKGVRWDIPAVLAYRSLPGKRTSPTAETLTPVGGRYIGGSSGIFSAWRTERFIRESW